MTTRNFVYCSHCLYYSKAAIEADFYSCSTCGKLISEVNVKENSVLLMKKKKKKFRVPRFKRTRKAAMETKPKLPLGSDLKKNSLL